jgi:hypothetical protein
MDVRWSDSPMKNILGQDLLIFEFYISLKPAVCGDLLQAATYFLIHRNK